MIRPITPTDILSIRLGEDDPVARHSHSPNSAGETRSPRNGTDVSHDNLPVNHMIRRAGTVQVESCNLYRLRLLSNLRNFDLSDRGERSVQLIRACRPRTRRIYHAEASASWTGRTRDTHSPTGVSDVWRAPRLFARRGGPVQRIRLAAVLWRSDGPGARSGRSVSLG